MIVSILHTHALYFFHSLFSCIFVSKFVVFFVSFFFFIYLFFVFVFGVFDSLIVQLQVAQYVITRLYRFCFQPSTQTITFQSKRKRSQQRCKTDRTTNIANINLLCLNVNSVVVVFCASLFVLRLSLRMHVCERKGNDDTFVWKYIYLNSVVKQKRNQRAKPAETIKKSTWLSNYGLCYCCCCCCFLNSFYFLSVFVALFRSNRRHSGLLNSWLLFYCSNYIFTYVNGQLLL